jgi:hypothetical protein
VKSLAAFGTRQEDIATVIGIRSTNTLRKHFRQELARGEIEATAQVGQTLLQMATSGNHVGATIFWLKTRAGWRGGQNSANESSSIPDFIVALDKKAA